MWLKFFSITLLFYFLAILQNSFFSHFSFFGSFLNFVFILFFLLVFFGKQKKVSETIFYSLVSGFFLDVFLNLPFGVSMLSLLITGLLIKKIQDSLQGKNDVYPIFYFVPIFIIAFFAYGLLSAILASFFESNLLAYGLSWTFIVGMFYNLFVSVVLFYFCKKFILKGHGKNI